MESTPEKLEMFYEGKAKKLYATADPDLVIAYFKDDATAFNAKKRGTIEDKGVINNRMSELFFGLLEAQWRQDAFRPPAERPRHAVQAAPDCSGRDRRAQHLRGLDGQAAWSRRGRGAQVSDRRVLLQSRTRWTIR